MIVRITVVNGKCHVAVITDDVLRTYDVTEVKGVYGVHVPQRDCTIYVEAKMLVIEEIEGERYAKILSY